MNIKLKIGILISIFFIVVIMLFVIVIKIKSKKSIEENIKKMPEFAFATLIDKELFTNRDLVSDQSTLIIYFSTECKYCKVEAKNISQSIDQFGNCNILMVSFEEINVLKAFAEKYNFTEKEKVSVLHDRKMKFDDIFGRTPLPTSFIYNNKGELVKKFIGEVKIEILLKYMQ
jgi:peroxiredoxin